MVLIWSTIDSNFSNSSQAVIHILVRKSLSAHVTKTLEIAPYKDVKRSCTWLWGASRWTLAVWGRVLHRARDLSESQGCFLFFHCWLFASSTSQIIHNRWLLCVAFLFFLGSTLIYPTLFSIVEFNNPPQKGFTC